MEGEAEGHRREPLIGQPVSTNTDGFRRPVGEPRPRFYKRILLWALLLVGFVTGATIALVLSGQGHQASFQTFDLGGHDWWVVNGNGTFRVPAFVPGSVHTDLLSAGVITEPYYRDNDVLLRWIALEDWTYSRTFTLKSEWKEYSQVVLVCDGLDTIATITLNGISLGSADNMFRRYTFDVTDALRGGKNDLVVAFTSPKKVSDQRAEAYPYPIPSADTMSVQHGELGRPFIRKAQCHWSWDWGPCFLPQGIWLPIRLEAHAEPTLSEIAVYVSADNDLSSSFNIDIDFFISSTMHDTVELQVKVDDTSAEKTVTVEVEPGCNLQHRVTLEVTNVKRWWPNGFGDAVLYDLHANLVTPSGSIEKKTRRIGFRSVELVTEPIPGQEGLSMFFRVNGVPIFAKGANWIPADSFENRVTHDVLVNLLQSSVDANMNMVRTWGGGIYQHDDFYDLCDAMGLMVWEEFMFACAAYPRDSAFLADVSEEVTYQVRRLSHHPSIVLWSGNNENEAALGWFTGHGGDSGMRDLYLADYVKLYFDTVREALVAEDTTRPFWPSSPSNGPLVEHPVYVGRWGSPYNNSIGDNHFYNYESPCLNVTFFPRTRFASEYGFQSYPSLYTWKPVTIEEDWVYNSDMMQHRQHHSKGIEQLEDMIRVYFHFPTNADPVLAFDHFNYVSQVLQGSCIRAQTEFYRRLRGEDAHTMGALYWQLNDIWQAPSWASLEYGGRWKILHYFAKEFFTPLLLSTYEDPMDTLHIHVSNDYQVAFKGSVRIECWSWAGTLNKTWTVEVDAPASDSVEVATRTISTLMADAGMTKEDAVLLLSLYETEEEILSRVIFFPVVLASVDLPVVHIEITQVTILDSRKATVTLSSDGMAMFVFVDTETDGHFSANAFPMTSNEIRTLDFVAWEDLPDLDTFQAGLHVRSLRDTYPA